MLNESELLAAILPYPRLRLERGEGSWVWDVDGKRYLDFTAGLGVMALGHADAELTAVLTQQFAKLGHCSNLYSTTPQLELAERLTKHSFATRAWFSNSGTEANEAALKFARLYGHAHARGANKAGFVAFTQGFHGRTFGSLAVTHEPAYREPFIPLTGPVRFASLNDLESVRSVMGPDICAIIVEPVQGEGGVLPADKAFLAGLRELCDTYNALLIFDEIQCGMGRLGTLFAYEQFGVVPDIMTLAKPIAGGLPLGAVLINDRVAGLLKPGHHGSTFAGGPAVCAVANYVFDRINAAAFLQQVRESGDYLRDGLQNIVSSTKLYSSTRGEGLMRALIIADAEQTPPSTLLLRAREAGLLVSRAGKSAIRLLPPLNCSRVELDYALTILEQISK